MLVLLKAMVCSQETKHIRSCDMFRDHYVHYVVCFWGLSISEKGAVSL